MATGRSHLTSWRSLLVNKRLLSATERSLWAPGKSLWAPGKSLWASRGPREAIWNPREIILVHREIIRVPKVVPGNLREVHRNLFTRIEVIWHILASRRGHLGPKGGELRLHEFHLGPLRSHFWAPGKSLGELGISQASGRWSGC